MPCRFSPRPGARPRSRRLPSQLAMLAVLGALSAACGKHGNKPGGGNPPSNNPPDDNPPTDEVPPTVTLQASRGLVTSAGALTLTADASDDTGVQKVVFKRDGAAIGEVAAKPFALDVDVTGALNGRHAFSATAYDAAGNHADSAEVRVLVSIGNRFFGTAVGGAADIGYGAFGTYFDQITPENAGKWGSVEATQGTRTWDDLDAAYQYAKSRGYRFKFHTLVWGQQQPGWMSALPPDQQLQAVDDWMAAVAERYPDIDLVDVVNEPLHAPPGYKDALGGDGVTGWDWVVKAFEMARQHFPRAELLLNDYNIVILPQFTQDYLEIIDILQQRGLIDGIGEQGHFLERAETPVVKEDLAALAATDLPIYISELDLNFADDLQHANRMKELFTAIWDNPSVLGVTHWGFRQGAMWRTNGYLVKSDGTPRAGLEWLHCYLNGGSGTCTVPPYVEPARAGTPFDLTLQAEEYDAAQGLIASGSQVAYTVDGSWMRFDRVVFHEAYDTLRVHYAKGNDTGGSVTLHLDDPKSTPIATVSFSSTGDWGSFQTITVPLQATATGEHTLFVLFHDGGDGIANVDWLDLGSPLRTGDADRIDIAAASFDDAGAITVDGASIASSAGGSAAYAAYGNVVVNGYTVLTASYSRASGDAGTIEVHRDSIDGAVVARLTAPSTGGAPGQTSSVLDLGPGTYDLYFVFSDAGMGQFQQFSLVKSDLGPNLVANSTFETSAAGWSSWGGTVSTSSERAHGGSQSLLVSDRPASGTAVYGLTGSVAAGLPYRASLYVSLRNAATDQTVKLTAKRTCAGTTSYDSLGAVTVPASASATWTLLSTEFRIASGCTSLDEYLVYVEGPDAGVDIFLDDVSVQQKLAQNLVANGDIETGSTDPWSSWLGALSVTTTRVHGGSYSLLTAPGGLAATDLKDAVTPGKSYPVSVWVTIGQDGGTAPDSAVHVTSAIKCSTDASTTYSWFINPQTVKDGAWTNLTGTLAVPACTGGTLAQLQVYLEGPSDPVRIYVDDMVITGN